MTKNEFYAQNYFKYEDLTKEPFCDFFDTSDRNKLLTIDFYKRMNEICSENNLPNFLLPFVGSDYYADEDKRVLLIAESKYINISNDDENKRKQDLELGRKFFSFVLDVLNDKTNGAMSESLLDFINRYNYTIFNQEPFISYIKVRSAELGFAKMRCRDFGGWPFPYLIREMNAVFGYQGSKKRAQLNMLKHIAYINYFQIPFVVESSKEKHGFTNQKYSELIENNGISFEKYCEECDRILDKVIETLNPSLIVFASKYGASVYNGSYKEKVHAINHPVSWRDPKKNDKKKLNDILMHELKQKVFS